MSTNPLEPDPDRDARTRLRAYHLWQADGEPHGADLEYWERAAVMVRMEDSAGAAQLNPRELSQTDSTGRIIEEASIQDNLGEFPDRLSDQGDHPQTPSVRNRSLG